MRWSCDDLESGLSSARLTVEVYRKDGVGSAAFVPVPEAVSVVQGSLGIATVFGRGVGLHRDRYRVKVEVSNSAGMQSLALTDGVLVDATAPHWSIH